MRTRDHGRFENSLQITTQPNHQEPAGVEDIAEFARTRLGFEADEKQLAVLRGGRRGIVNCTRQLRRDSMPALAKPPRKWYKISRASSLLTIPAATTTGVRDIELTRLPNG